VDNFEERCFKAREALKVFEGIVLDLRNNPGDLSPLSNLPEMMANVMLAYRHLEDLRMRLGKAIQAYDGGNSVYPR
jgi:hypothetical protein